MKIYLSDNIFTRALSKSLPAELNAEVSFVPSAMVTKELNSSEDACAFIPTTDLINNKELFISKELGISFDGSLCNTYIYFAGGEDTVEQINLAGDISSIEVILTKILFKEIYNVEVELNLDTSGKSTGERNILLTGDANFNEESYKKGLSFSEEIVETLSFPFVNYVLASKQRGLIEKINGYADVISNNVYDELEKEAGVMGISEDSSVYIRENAASLIIKFEQQDVDGISQLLRLPYFYGMINSIIELNLV